MTVVGGIWRDGRVEVAAPPANIRENAPVLVTFLAPSDIDLAAHGISPAQAAELRARLATFADDWNAPGMAVYDDYEAARAGQPSGLTRGTLL